MSGLERGSTYVKKKKSLHEKMKMDEKVKNQVNKDTVNMNRCLLNHLHTGYVKPYVGTDPLHDMEEIWKIKQR